MNRVRCVFMGTAAMACPSLSRLLAWPGATVVGVVTQPDRPAGRGWQLRPSPVKQLALASGVPVLQPERVREPAFQETLRALGPELIVVMAFGQILPRPILQLPRFGCLNIHTSLLPRYRGAAPIQWALIRGETETGVTLMLMDEGLDTGPIVAQRAISIGPTDTAASLHDRLAHLGADLLIETLPAYLAGHITPQPQPAEGVSHAPRLRKEDGRIDWTLPATEIERRVRAFDPWPGSFTWWWPAENRCTCSGSEPRPAPARPRARPLMLKVWRAAVAAEHGPPGQVLEVGPVGVLVGCGSGALYLLQVQPEGGRRMGIGEFLAGHPVRRGDRFGDGPPPVLKPASDD